MPIMELEKIKARASAPKKVRVKVKVVAPVTRLHHCYLDITITEEPVELDDLDGWTKAQIDAGKLALC